MGVLHSTQSKEGRKCQHVTEVVQADSNSSEEEIMTAEIHQGNLGSIEGDSSEHMSDNSPTKIGGGMPEGSNKLKICVTDDINIMKLVSCIASDGSIIKQKEEEGSGDDHADISVQTQVSQEQASKEDSLRTDQSPKKRGRPRKSEKPDVKHSPKGDSKTPKRGRPKGSTKHKLACLTSEENEGPTLGSELSSEEEDEEEDEGSQKSPIRKRGRPMKVVTPGGAAQNASNETPEKSNRGRGRPRKIIVKESEGEQEVVSDGSPPVKKARGRPKGSLTKKVLDEEGKPDSNLPKKLPVKRGRPRKYPLPTPEELNKPKVWKKLGRPPKNPPASLSSPSCDVDIPKKRGRPPGNPKSDVGTPRKSDASSETKLETSLTEHPE